MMKINYVLTYTRYKGYAVDTIIIAISKNRNILEEFILSVWEDKMYYEFLDNYDFGCELDKSILMAKESAKYYAADFNITAAPIFE